LISIKIATPLRQTAEGSTTVENAEITPKEIIRVKSLGTAGIAA
jgi:hypothetical protein